MYGEWRRKRQGTYVTAETKIPEMPKKILSEPDDVTYHMKQAEIDEKIETLNTEFSELTKNFELKRRGLKEDQTGRGDISRQLKDQFAELSIWSGKRRVIMAAMEKVEREISDLDKQRGQLRR